MKKDLAFQEDEEEQSAYGDVYDLVGEALQVTSNTGVYNKDFVLSNLTKRESYFVNSQIQVVAAVRAFMLTPSKKQIRNTKNAEKKAELRELRRISDRTTINLMTEVFGKIIMSRAKEGMIIKSVLEMGMEGERKIEKNEEKGIGARIIEALKGEKGEKEDKILG